jgi:CubicO group peptidase (beta-lactamase class C family)
LWNGNSNLEEQWQPLIRDDKTLSKVLERICTDYNQPAIGAALVLGEDIVAKACVGTAVYGENQPVNLNSRFHIGSTTKSMTALLIAMLVDEGKLSWNTTLEQALPNIPMMDVYKKVTIDELLLCKAGIIPFQTTNSTDPIIVKKLFYEIPDRYSDPTEQRIEVAKVALNTEPIAQPGTKAVYSNVGWAIAGLIAELAAGQPFEDLIQQRLFDPLGMTAARLGGWPASESDPSQPRGHYIGEDQNHTPVPQPLNDEYILPAWMNPSGGVHCSILDYALYVQENLLGLLGKGKLLDEAGYRILHTIHDTVDLSEMYFDIAEHIEATMGYGWAVVDVGGDLLSAADGSAGTFYARIVVFPSLNVAFVGFTNCGSGSSALDEVIEQLTGFKWQS